MRYFLKKTEPLSETKDIKWERVGGAAATGLDHFGLTWTSNTGTSAVIKKGADKFVELNPGDWTNFTTLEEVVGAIDAATDIKNMF